MGQTHVGSQINSQIHMMAYTLVLVLGSHWLLSMCGALAQSTLLAIFGDSLSDTGRLYNMTSGKNPRAPPYFQGRFTNAPGNWVDQLVASAPELAVANFAFGGSTACTYNSSVFGGYSAIPSLDAQISLFYSELSSSKVPAARPRYTLIWSGENDLLLLPLAPPRKWAAITQAIVPCLTAAAERLLKQGEEGVVLTSVSALNLDPGITWQTGSSYTSMIKSAIADTNAKLQQVVANLSKQYPKQKVLYWDSNGNLTRVFSQYRDYGFKSASRPCLIQAPGVPSAMSSSPGVLCSRPDDYVFFDGFHPSAKTFGFLAQSARAVLEAGGILTSTSRAGGDN